jgi:hypothetical protein
MNLINSSAVPLILEEMVRPVVGSPELFKVFSRNSSCPLKGAGTKMCCSKGRTLPYHGIYPFENGLVVESNGEYLLNGITPIDEYSPPGLVPAANTDKSIRTVLGYSIPYRILHAYAHPWGAMIVTEDCVEGLSIVLLVLPQ